MDNGEVWVVLKNTEGAIAHGEEGFCPLSPSHLVEIDRCVVAAAAAESCRRTPRRASNSAQRESGIGVGFVVNRSFGCM